MSYLALLRKAEARLRATQPTYERDEVTKERSSAAEPAPQPQEAPPRVSDMAERRQPVAEASHDPRHVAEALPFLGMPLDVFARAGASLEVCVPWLDVTLWMVPTDRDAAALIAKGIHRGRIWTAAELMDLMAIADRTPEVVKTLTHAKIELDGEITQVRPRSDN